MTARVASAILLLAALACTSAQERRIEDFTGGGGSGVVLQLKRQVRSAPAALEAAYADGGRYDAFLLAEMGFTPRPGGTYIVVFHDSTFAFWAMFAPHDTLLRCRFELGRDSAVVCSVPLPPSADSIAPRLFSAAWVKDSTHGWTAFHRLATLPPAAFATDSMIQHSGVRLTAGGDGWRADRDFLNWTCASGAGALAPPGVEPGGVICRALPMAPTPAEGTRRQ